ncbi:ABC transporter ATP-binding protein [Hydrogenophaga crassostreae]|uniref:ABC transporter ATP-binding protein n=1 Tax=Hydrogenophaga crassostreae TaxID=1763535 RepID=A0A162SQL0_9BURK|nr:ABC transporter ATP-binding protein [Hydrogenophaga crassostreae]AOW15059.1 ABC transporter ATP-binding protein [Hydrogenophaga crassostreae]OAD39512.1 ABC transporter ATP-binding protein [Hydrogenophaga crassostreae]
MTDLLHVDQLTAGYGAIQVLHGINLSLASGGRLALIGRNGVGKTTLLKAIMGLADVKAGHIRLDGQDITRWSTRQRAQAGIGYVPQTRDIFPSLTVEENLVAGLKGRPRSALDEAYALFPRLAERRHNGGQQLSGGEQQMLSVARTLLGKPTLLLLDEPLEGLAPIICIELMRAFEHLARDTGVAVLLVEQKVDDALRFAPSAMVLERGEVVHESESAALGQRKDLLERYVGVAGAH